MLLAAQPGQVADSTPPPWVEGLLRGSGLLLIHDAALWAISDSWASALPSDSFPAVLPLLRRTFASFAVGERRQLGERAARGRASAGPVHATLSNDFSAERAEAALALVAQIFGVAS